MRIYIYIIHSESMRNLKEPENKKKKKKKGNENQSDKQVSL